MAMEVGWLVPGARCEVVDVEEVWTPATVLKRCPGSIMVHFDGWPARYDEVVPLSRVAKPGAHTIRRRCWVTSSNRRIMPAIALLRSPASKRAVNYLTTEKSMVFLVATEKRLTHRFIAADRVLSWNEKRANSIPVSIMSKFQNVPFDDELPMLFLRGTLAADARLQNKDDFSDLELSPDVMESIPDVEEMERSVTSKRSRRLDEELVEHGRIPQEDDTVPNDWQLSREYLLSLAKRVKEARFGS